MERPNPANHEDRHADDPRLEALSDIIRFRMDDPSGTWDAAHDVIDWINANTVPKELVHQLIRAYEGQRFPAYHVANDLKEYLRVAEVVGVTVPPFAR